MKKEGLIAVKVFTILSTAILLIFLSSFRSKTVAIEDSPLSLTLVNEQRNEFGLNELVWNQDLANVALAKANDMVINKYFDHTSPEGLKAWDFILAEGYDYKNAGENLAIDFSNLNAVYKAWMDSETHRNNILSKNYTDFGFARLKGNVEGYETEVFVQIFGRK